VDDNGRPQGPVRARSGGPTETVVVVDIDGVLADVAHRLAHLRSRPARWAAFFAAAGADPPLEAGVALARGYAAQGLGVVYLTGRPERIRALTADWLRRHDLPAGRLLMRPDPDRRPAPVLKREVVSRLADEVVIHLVVDDDDRVVDALRAAGFPVLLATWAPRSRELGDAQDRRGRT